MRRTGGLDPGGEPLLHKEIGQIAAELVKRKKFVILCTNALLLEKKLNSSPRARTSPSASTWTA
jgi:molybdenum cofactor biosynthesis enzyme MoaA